MAQETFEYISAGFLCSVFFSCYPAELTWRSLLVVVTQQNQGICQRGGGRFEERQQSRVSNMLRSCRRCSSHTLCTLHVPRVSICFMAKLWWWTLSNLQVLLCRGSVYMVLEYFMGFLDTGCKRLKELMHTDS
jgi:hypothetical protein